jgi:hypothetical protein
MTKTFSLEEALKPSETTIPKTFSLEDAIKPIDQPSGNIVKDLGISALQGLLGAKEAAVGIANLPTFGLIGKTTEAIEKGVFGGTSKDAREALQKLKSETQQSEEQRISEAFREEGILPGLKEAVTSPRVIASSITESLPSMIGGVAIGRKALQVGAKRLGAEVAGPEVPGYLIKKFGSNVAPIVAGAFGEAAVSAGAISEATRQEEDSGYLNPKQVALSTLAGGLTVTGAALNASAVAVTASALRVTNDITGLSKVYAAVTGGLSAAVTASDSASGRDLSYAAYLLDQRITSISSSMGASASSITSAYEAVRVVTTGSISGDAYVELTALKAGFDTGSLDYISLDVVVKSGSGGDWQNDLVAVHLNTGSGAGSTPNTGSLYVTITALSEATNYRLIAVNEKPGKFTI